MAGHSHWANIARKKALVDNKRGKVWSKLSNFDRPEDALAEFQG